MNSAATISDRLRQAALESPSVPAIVMGDGSVTYAELDETADRVAGLLVDLGVQPGDRVGVLMRKSVEAVEAQYGIMRAGAAYVPLDASAPDSRIAYIISNAEISVVLTSGRSATRTETLVGLGATLKHVVVMEDSDAVPPGPGVIRHSRSEVVGHDRHSSRRVIGDDLAFILYTSGSTGDPKGVMLSHTNCLAFVDWAVREFKVGSDDRLSSHAPFHFDLSTFDLYGAASVGATVVLVPARISVFPSEVIRFIEDNGITVWYSVPSILSMMVTKGGLTPDRLEALRLVLFAEEIFPTKHLSRLMSLLPRVKFANLYGPTETNVCTGYRVVKPPSETAPPVSIGSAIANVETFVIDADGKEVGPGMEGELVVRGPTVMKGYLGDPIRTRERLGPSPLPRHHGDLVYRTGDLVVTQPDGNYRFVGRRDNQIKSRGYRIELGDIESALNSHAGVLECVVLAIPDEVVTNRIVAYVAGESGVDGSVLSAHCAGLVPKYMIPEKFVVLDALPKTSTGKLNRKVVAEMAVSGGNSPVEVS